MTHQPTYIEQIALAVYRESEDAGPDDRYPDNEAGLYLGYAVLVLAKGRDTTSEDVHHAWSAWAVIEHDGRHRSLIPFEDLTPEIQAFDDVYRDAIHKAAAALDGVL